MSAGAEEMEMVVLGQEHHGGGDGALVCGKLTAGVGEAARTARRYRGGLDLTVWNLQLAAA
ncbi:hypothetical protein ACP4OV_005319 [Aristida adscensionis]